MAVFLKEDPIDHGWILLKNSLSVPAGRALIFFFNSSLPFVAINVSRVLISGIFSTRREMLFGASLKGCALLS